MSELTHADSSGTDADKPHTRTGVVAVGGVLAALAASTCCIIPLALFSLGVGGAWIGQLTALAPYQPIFVALALALLGYGYWLVHRQSKLACAEGDACASPLPNRIVKVSLWFASALVALALAWPYLVPFILG